jgi:hypothetical protein
MCGLPKRCAAVAEGCVLSGSSDAAGPCAVPATAASSNESQSSSAIVAAARACSARAARAGARPAVLVRAVRPRPRPTRACGSPCQTSRRSLFVVQPPRLARPLRLLLPRHDLGRPPHPSPDRALFPSLLASLVLSRRAASRQRPSSSHWQPRSRRRAEPRPLIDRSPAVARRGRTLLARSIAVVSRRWRAGRIKS